MTYTINAGLHSSEKDHTVMTGGTLTIDKYIESDSPMNIYTYALHLFGAPTTIDYQHFHAGMHTNEHLLAYTPDTGSLRASLKNLLPDLDTKMILDVSPYEFEDGTYGFRITSLVELDETTLTEATKASIDTAINYLDAVKAGHGDPRGFRDIPFATPEQCGQFTYHHPEKAQEILKMVNRNTLNIQANTQTTEHQKAVVCDLRLLKPKTDEADTRITLDPKFSYFLSQTIEHELPKKMPGTAVVVGTFGCMTGTYLCVSCVDPESDITVIHRNIMEILGEIDQESITPDHREQLKTILENFEKYGKK